MAAGRYYQISFATIIPFSRVMYYFVVFHILENIEVPSSCGWK
jgi:hypothetical protein